MSSAAASTFVEEAELHGHIIDSLLLPTVLDEILTNGATFSTEDVRSGKSQADTSHARIEVRAESAEELEKVLHAIHEHGAVPSHVADCQTAIADIAAAFPEGFYSTTNFRTQVRL